jgi:Uncharacterized NAD(FAD)-dependent dehydrogenases
LERTSDVLIAGGGFAGLALACALRQSLGPSFRVIVADPLSRARRPMRARPRSPPLRGGYSKPSGSGLRSPMMRNRFSTW